MKYVLFLLLAAMSVYSQTYSHAHKILKAKCGTPVSETFQVRPGITVTAFYTPSGAIKSMSIAPDNVSNDGSQKGAHIDQKILYALVDDLVPAKDRGELVIGSFIENTCFVGRECIGINGAEEDYKKLTILYSANAVLITWKDSPKDN